MKINLAILSSDQKSIDFIKKNQISDVLNLYANSSRNIESAEIFADSYNFEKYYGSYEDLIKDKGVDFILNFLPSGIKFEYTYLCLKNNIKVITDYPIISNSNDLEHFEELINSKLINNLFLVDEINIKKLYEQSVNQNIISFTKYFHQSYKLKNSLDNQDVLFELCPELFYLIYKYRSQKISIFKKDVIIDKITRKISYFKCDIKINKNLDVKVLLNGNNSDNQLSNRTNEEKFILDKSLYNTKELNYFINSKNSFENLSIFTYYPFKLFQEVLNE